MNSVSIRNYGETLEVIRELKKLGFLKSSKPKKKKVVENPEEVKQESDLVGYTIDNIPSFMAVRPDMTQSQIEDINRRQAVAFQTLKAEVEQQRLEDINFLEAQRSGDITRFQSEFNRIFTNNPEKPFDPLANLNSNRLDNGIPDINEDTFSGGINEGAPNIIDPLATGVFPETDKDGFSGVQEEGFVFDENPMPPRLQPRKPVDKFTSKRAQTVSELGFPPVPKIKSSLSEIQNYYLALVNEIDRPFNLTLKTKQSLLNEIYRIVDEEGESV